jgi:hypothetical protein
MRVSIALWLDDSGPQTRLKVSDSSYQYQDDEAGQREILRYDYLRQPHRHEPAAHLNIYANLTVPGALPTGRPLSRVHFPTGRIALESVIRMLADDFRIPTATDETTWRPVLAASESLFAQVAHQP